MPDNTRRGLRFSIRGLLVLTLVVALFLTWHIRQSRIHGVVENLKGFGARVEYHPSWFPQRIFGNYCDDPKSINLRRILIKDENLEAIGVLQRLESIDLAGTEAGHEALRHLSKLPKLKRLAFWDCGRLDVQQVNALLQLPKLEVLDVHDTKVSLDQLRSLASIPSLKRLIFSAPQYDDAFRLTSETITALSQVNAKPVGALLCTKINDADFDRIAAMDLSQTSKLVFFESQLSARSLRRIKKYPDIALEFQNCPLTLPAIQALDCQTRRTRFYAPKFTLAELAAELAGFKTIIAQTYAVDFHSALHRTRSVGIPGDNHVRIWNAAGEEPTYGNQFTAEVLRNQHGLQTVICGPGMSKVVLEMIAEIQPSIQLDFTSRYDPRLTWQTIEQCPSLTGLELNWQTGGQPRFTGSHRLKRLTINDKLSIAFEPSVDFFREIAKLADLEQLYLMNNNVLSPDVLEPLRKLTNLKYAQMANLDEDARRMLEEMGFSLSQYHRQSDNNEAWTFQRE